MLRLFYFPLDSDSLEPLPPLVLVLPVDEPEAAAVALGLALLVALAEVGVTFFLTSIIQSQ